MALDNDTINILLMVGAVLTVGFLLVADLIFKIIYEKFCDKVRVVLKYNRNSQEARYALQCHVFGVWFEHSEYRRGDGAAMTEAQRISNRHKQPKIIQEVIASFDVKDIL